jgi:hypothetical protein
LSIPKYLDTKFQYIIVPELIPFGIMVWNFRDKNIPARLAEGRAGKKGG